MTYKYHEGSKFPVKSWTEGVPIALNAIEQTRHVANMPFIYKHVALMPDVHWGMGATVGSVIATKGAIIPAAVGVDIGCGMIAMKLDLWATDLPDSLAGLRSRIEKAVPHGRTNNGRPGDRGAWGQAPRSHFSAFNRIEPRLNVIMDKHPKLLRSGTVTQRAVRHLGTLGTGNHFIEICLDENQQVWIMLHSGSRGIGNAIGMYFINLAKEDMRKWFINLPDDDLAYVVDGTDHFEDYLEAVEWAQEYAHMNRQLMMQAAHQCMVDFMRRPVLGSVEAINCHHNYISFENHFGSNVWVTRKGAVRARKGDLGIIPGSMGAKSFIVEGLGNDDSFHSCSHGAGRVMSRNEAKKQISVLDHIVATHGVECRKDPGVIDESPAAYKDIDAVMAAQSDLVKIRHTLKQVMCIKG